MINSKEIARQMITGLFLLITECVAKVIPSISAGEYKDIALEVLEDNEESRKRCPYGEYLSFATKNCKECDRDCPNGKNMQNCGYDCRDYFQLKTQEEEMRKYKAETEQKFENIFLTQNLLIAGLVLALLVMVIYGIYRCCSSRRKTKASQKTSSGVGSVQQATTCNDNRQDGVLNSSTKTIGDIRNSATAFQNTDLQGRYSDVVATTVTENASVDNKATAFNTEPEQDRQSSGASAESLTEDNDVYIRPMNTVGDMNEQLSDTTPTVAAEEMTPGEETGPLISYDLQRVQSDGQTAIVVAETKPGCQTVFVSVIQHRQNREG